MRHSSSKNHGFIKSLLPLNFILLCVSVCPGQYEAGVYRVVNLGDAGVGYELSLEVEASPLTGGRVVQFHYWDPLSGDQQKKWMVVPSGKDLQGRQLYFLINYRYKKALDTQTDEFSNLYRLTVQEGTGELDQKWYIEPRAYMPTPGVTLAGGIIIRSAQTGKELIANNWPTPPPLYINSPVEWALHHRSATFTDATITRDNEHYYITNETPQLSFPNSPTGYYFLVPEYDNRKAVYLAGQDQGSGQQAFCGEYPNNSEAHQWKFIRDAQGYYQIENRRSQLHLSIGGGLLTNGGPGIGWSNWNGDDQKWSIIPVEGQDGYYFLFNKNSGRALTVQREGDPSYTTEIRNEGMVQWMCRNLPAQKFKFIPAVLPATENTVVINNSQNGFDFERLVPPQNIYKFSSLSNNKVVEVESGALAGGTKVQQFHEYARNGISADGHNQEWLIVPAGKRNDQLVFFIINNGFLKYLQSGDEATVQTGNDGANQLWALEPTNTANVFFFKSIATGKFLQIPLSDEDGASLQTHDFTGHQDQQFRLIQYVGNTGPGTYQEGSHINICSKMNSNKAINIADASTENGAAIQLYDVLNGANNEHFKLVRTNDGYYKIQSALKCIDVTGWEAGNNSNLVSWDCADVQKQKWLIIPVAREPGNYIFFNKMSGRCMDIANASAENGATIQTFLFINQDNQKWQFREAR